MPGFARVRGTVWPLLNLHSLASLRFWGGGGEEEEKKRKDARCPGGRERAARNPRTFSLFFDLLRHHLCRRGGKGGKESQGPGRIRAERNARNAAAHFILTLENIASPAAEKGGKKEKKRGGGGLDVTVSKPTRAG